MAQDREHRRALGAWATPPPLVEHLVARSLGLAWVGAVAFGIYPSSGRAEQLLQAIAYGVTVSGCTVHFVDEELDHGVIILQKTVPVLADDDEHTLAARIIVQEHVAYAEAIERVISGKYRFVGRRYVTAQTETE